MSGMLSATSTTGSSEKAIVTPMMAESGCVTVCPAVEET